MTGTFAFFRICILTYSPSKIICDCQQIWQSKNKYEYTEPATRRFSIELLFWKISQNSMEICLHKPASFLRKDIMAGIFLNIMRDFTEHLSYSKTSRQMDLDTSISTSNNMFNVKYKANIEHYIKLVQTKKWTLINKTCYNVFLFQLSQRSK